MRERRRGRRQAGDGLKPFCSSRLPFLLLLLVFLVLLLVVAPRRTAAGAPDRHRAGGTRFRSLVSTLLPGGSQAQANDIAALPAQWHFGSSAVELDGDSGSVDDIGDAVVTGESFAIVGWRDSHSANKTDGFLSTVLVTAADADHGTAGAELTSTLSLTGSAWDTAIAVGAYHNREGNNNGSLLWVAGGTSSRDFLLLRDANAKSTPAAILSAPALEAASAAFPVVKGFAAILQRDPDNGEHLYGTFAAFWGGLGETIVSSLAIDEGSGDVVVVGSIDRPHDGEFMLTAAAAPPEPDGDIIPLGFGQFDAFALRFSPSGELLFTSLFGGAGHDSADSVAFLGGSGRSKTATSGDLVVVGTTPLDRVGDKCGNVVARKEVMAGGSMMTAYLLVLESQTGCIRRGTLLPSTANEYGKSVAVSPRSIFFVTMTAEAPGSATKIVGPVGAEPVAAGSTAVSVWSCARTEDGDLNFRRLVNVRSSDSSAANAAAYQASTGLLHITGFTKPVRSSFPLVNSFARPPRGGENTDTAFLISLDDGGNLAQSTVFGGSEFEWATGLAVTDTKILVTGWTGSSDFRKQRTLRGSRKTHKEEAAFVVAVATTPQR